MENKDASKKKLVENSSANADRNDNITHVTQVQGAQAQKHKTAIVRTVLIAALSIFAFVGVPANNQRSECLCSAKSH